ncbi:TPA: plasmid replication protein, CyRepA1 family [Vibrio cholerae]
MNTSPLLSFFRDRFNSGYDLYDYFLNEIEAEAAVIGVDWSKVSDRITWQGGAAGKINATGKHLLNGFKNSVGIYASMEHKDGITYPLITLKNKGGAGETVVINGFMLLVELYRNEKDSHFASRELDDWKSKKAERDKERARKQEAARAEKEREEARKAAHVQKELSQHYQLPLAGSFVYAAKKKIDDILSVVDARQGTDKHGSFISLLLQNVKGEAVGVQRIYEKHITKKDGSQTNKDFTWGMAKDGAHIVIGDLNTSELIYVVEGFATGASIYKAWQSVHRNVAVIVAIDAGNKLKVVADYKKHRPHLELIDAADNDLWKCKQGKGNKGMQIAFELISSYEGMKSIVPSFEKVDPAYQPTDWNDLHVHAGVREVLKQLKSKAAVVKLDGDLFENALSKMEFISHEKAEISKAAKAAANAGMAMFPKYTPRDVLNMIRLSLQHAKGRYDLTQVKRHIEKTWRAKVRTAQAPRSFSSRITNDKHRPEHITYTHYKQTRIDENVRNHIQTLNGIVVVRAGKGSGKTKELITPGMWAMDKTAFFAHRVSLIGGAEATINKFKPQLTDSNGNAIPDTRSPVLNYQDDMINVMAQYATKLACCINSCLKGKFNPILNDLDALFIDEACQTLRHITCGGAIAYPVAVFNRLIDMMVNTKHQVLLADADANDTLLEFCELALAKRNAAREAKGLPLEQIHVIELDSDSSYINVKYADSDSVFQKALDDLAAGQRVLVATDSSNEAENLFARMKELNPNKKGLLINASEKVTSREAEAFCDEPDTEQLKYDYLVYSPAISSGVSLETKHFTRHYGLFRGVVAPSDALQMMHRDRNARDFIIGLATMHNKREESAINMWLGLLCANDNQLNVNLNKDTGIIEVSTDDQQFDRFRIELSSQENAAKNDFASNMICIMCDEGYQVSRLDVSELDIEKGKSEKEAARELVKAQELARHLEQTTPSKEEYDELKKSQTISVDEKARLNRYDIENKLQMSVDEESVKFLRQGGIRKAENFELLQSKPSDLRLLDDAELNHGIQPTDRHYFLKRQRILRDFFEITGLCLKTGQGMVTPEKLQEAMEHITSGNSIHFFNNWAKLGGYIDPVSRRKSLKGFMDGLLSTVGLKVSSVQMGRKNADSDSRIRYIIKPESWAMMNGINYRRQQANVTALKIELLDGEVIHVSPVNYIYNEKNEDHPETNEQKASRWISLLKSSLNGLRIPLEYAKNLFAGGQWETVLEGVDSGNVSITNITDKISQNFTSDYGHLYGKS